MLLLFQNDLDQSNYDGIARYSPFVDHQRIGVTTKPTQWLKPCAYDMSHVYIQYKLINSIITKEDTVSFIIQFYCDIVSINE